MAGKTGAARITAGSLDLASTIRGWELHLRAGGRSPATLAPAQHGDHGVVEVGVVDPKADRSRRAGHPC